jgi:NADPH2:quinone reductase
MRAMVLTANDAYCLEDVAEPRPGPGEVAIRVAYAGLQWGDVLVRQGHFPVPRPFIPGFEAAGRIVAVGEGVDGARIGEAVAALTSSGAFAEVVVAPSLLTLPVGDLSLRVAAAFGWIGPTAYDLIDTVARVRHGESVLIHAAGGGVGTLAVQFAKRAGATRIVGVVGKAEQASYAAKFGYAEVVTSEEFPARVAAEKFDVILDPIGGAAREASLSLLAPHGRLVVYGNIATFEPVRVSANDLLGEGKSLLTYNSHLLSKTHRERFASSARRALDVIVRGEVTIDVSAEYDLAVLEDAIQRLADGRAQGKSIVRVAA